MIIFGMNAPGRLKWVCIAMLVIYYFFYVRSLYIQHFQQQRAMLNLNQRRGEVQPILVLQPGQELNIEGLEQLANNAADQQRREERAGRPPGFFHGLFQIVYFFFLSMNHDWMAPELRRLQQERDQRRREKERREQRKREKRLKRDRQRLLEYSKKLEAALAVSRKRSAEIKKEFGTQVRLDDVANAGGPKLVSQTPLLQNPDDVTQFDAPSPH